MTDVPIIAIDEIEDNNNDSSSKFNIIESHTDIEDFDSDNEIKKKSLISVLKPKIKPNGSVTDVEDFEDSDDNEYIPDENIDIGPEISLTEMLDQGCVDEHSNIQGNVNKTKLQGMQSIQKTPSPTAFHLTINPIDVGGITDVEDIEGSGDEAENEKNYSDDDKAIVLEGANVVDVHDSMNRKKSECKFVSKVVDASLSSSDSEDKKENVTKYKIYKQYSKKNNRCEEQKSDIEKIYFTDEEKKQSKQKSTPILDTPDIEIMAFEGSDNEEVDKIEQLYPEINITFITGNDEKKKKKHKGTPAPSPMLNLPANLDEANTDVENLNSSEDEDDGKNRSKKCLPLAVVKSDALTDVEDFDDPDSEEINYVENSPDINLPSPVREFTVLVESKSGEPYKQTTPLPNNILLGFDDLDADKGLTDVEDFSDESGNEDDVENDEMKYKVNFKFPDIDGGVVESSDHSVVKDSSLRVSHTPEPKTDTEDIYLRKPEKAQDCRRRRGKNKHHCNKAAKSNFLDTKFYDEGAGSAHTDVEDLHVEEDDIVLKDKNIKQRRATIECSPRKFSNGDTKTDVEYISCGDDILDENPCISDSVQLPSKTFLDTQILTMSRESIGKRKCEINKDLNIPLIRRISATPQPTPRCSITSGTDIENIQCDSDNDEYVSYSRAQTTTPIEINRQLAELSISEICDMNNRHFDHNHERFEIKEYIDNTEAHTDIEYLE